MLTPNKELAECLSFHVGNSVDFEETEKLKELIRGSLTQRSEPYLTSSELDLIVRWKLDKQYHRSKEQRKVNVDEVVIPITKSCFSIKSSNRNYEIELKLKVLTSMRGIALPIASSILAICHPMEFVVIDSVLWEGIFDEEKSSFTINDYLKFLNFFEELSIHTEKTLQETEHLLWLYLMTKV